MNSNGPVPFCSPRRFRLPPLPKCLKLQKDNKKRKHPLHFTFSEMDIFKARLNIQTETRYPYEFIMDYRLFPSPDPDMRILTSRELLKQLRLLSKRISQRN